MWVVEYNGTAQLGRPDLYDAIQQAEENFGAVPDQNGNLYCLRQYVPSGDQVSREEALLQL